MFWECINSLAPGRCANIFNYVGFKHNVVSDIKNSFSEIAPATSNGRHWWWVNIGSGYGLVALLKLSWE